MAFIDYETCEPLRIWDRLEPRPREADFDAALAARIHDPLWMLSRQWQMGEFQGEDTGSAVLAKLARRVTPVAAHQLGGGPVAAVETEDGTLPAETRVERLPIDFAPVVRAQIGRTFVRHAEQAAVEAPPTAPFDGAALRDALLPAFAIAAADPIDAADPVAAARARATVRARRMSAVLAGRALDGVALFDALAAAPAGTLAPGVAAATDPAHAALLLVAAERFTTWFRQTYPAPGVATPEGAWDPAALEYQGGARLATDRGTVELSLAEHASGDLDWWSYDQHGLTAGTASAAATDVRTVIPAPASFAGMPNPRWWQFEDAAVDLGHFRAQATDLARIVVAEFALVYGNNWFVVPVEQPVGTLAEIEGVLVTDVFGVRTLVGPAVEASSGAWSSWDLFSVSPRRSTDAPVLGQHLFLPPTLSHATDAEPHEVVAFVRDEVANLVWAVERRVADGLGGSEDGVEAARRFTAGLGERLAADAEAAAAAAAEATAAVDPASGVAPTPAAPASPAPAIRYRLGTEVSEAWIPFLPTHVPGDTRAVQLQRGAMPRFVDPAPPQPVRPRTSVLRVGVDPASGEPVAPYFVHEEEVPRTGVTVAGRLRRARWVGGRTVVWHSRTAVPGRGEVDSGLRFDVVEPTDVG